MRSWQLTRDRLVRLATILAGIVSGQAVLYGPSLLGAKVLLPVDILAGAGIYLPRTPEVKSIQIQNIYLSDLIYVFEPARRFAAAELRAGRLPMWAPYQYAGAPFVAPMYSPFLALEYLTSSPVVLAWGQLLAALVAGLGAYLFFRRTLEVGFWPAAFAAWCYPLTGFFVFWQGYPTGLSVYWLPWLLLAVHQIARRSNRSEQPRNDQPSHGEAGSSRRLHIRSMGARAFAPGALAVFTCLVLISGHIDVAGQVLLISGFYGLWCLYDAQPKAWFGSQARKTAMTLVVGWTLGLMLAAPHLLPLLE